MKATSLAFVAALSLVAASPSLSAEERGRTMPDFQLMFDFAGAVSVGDGWTRYPVNVMTMEGAEEPAGYVLVKGLPRHGDRCDKQRVGESWEYHIDRPLEDGAREQGVLKVDKAYGPLDYCGDEWHSQLDGRVTEASGDYEGLVGSFIRMEADLVFALPPSEWSCLCSVFLGQDAP